MLWMYCPEFLQQNKEVTNTENTVIYDLEAWANKTELYPYGVVGIDWSSNLGCGRWEMYFDEKGIPHLKTEHMDSFSDKSFSELLMKAMLDIAIVEE